MSNVDNLRATETRSFGATADGQAVSLYIVHDGLLEAIFTDFGARLVSLKVPDRTGKLDDVILGFDTREQYVADQKTYMGAIVGRYANRLAGGRFTLDGRAYQVPLNNDGNALHGGEVGFDRKVWQAHPIAGGVEMTYVSRAGEQGFPGTLTLTVRYTLVGGALSIDYAATTDAATVVNVTNHTYFNLGGESSGSIVAHELTVPADHFTPINANLIPTGALSSVAGTPFDFRNATVIGNRIEEPNEQLRFAGGYDHNWAFGAAGTLKTVAHLKDPSSGRVLTVQTTEPGVQFYSGNFLDGTLPNRTGGHYSKRSGLCLETQHYPDSPNHPSFPSTVLEAGATMRSTTVYAFSVEGLR